MSGCSDDSYAEAWLRWFPVIEGGAAALTARMLELSAIDDAGDVLDLGTGIGEPALTVATRLAGKGRVRAIDRDRRMIDHARARAAAQGLTNLGFDTADIDSVDLPANAYDVILARWSLMFVADLPAVLSRLQQALRAGGRLVLAGWGTPEQVPALTLARRVTAETRGRSPPVYGAGSPFCLCDTAALGEDLRQAGFDNVHTESLPVVYEYDSADAYIRARIDLTGPLWEDMATAAESERRRVFDAIEKALAPHRQPNGGYRLVNQAVIAAARSI